MTSPTADGVVAATHKLVHQAMTGQWQDVPGTIEERRVLLDRLSAGASPQDQPWLSALKQAMAESDAAVATMANGDGTRDSGLGNSDPSRISGSPNVDYQADAVASTLDMIRASR
ncbi:MAG: hypothetical protein ACREV5_18420 [Steroidobacter sp.]